MEVDLTPEEIEACIDALEEYPHSDEIMRGTLDKLRSLIETPPAPGCFDPGHKTNSNEIRNENWRNI